MENPSVLMPQTRAVDKCRSAGEELEAAAASGTTLIVHQRDFAPSATAAPAWHLRSAEGGE